MRILFLCGSFEEGRDGVGDYTRRLAVELIRQGHQVAGISFNDHGVDDRTAEQQFIGDTGFSILRLPSMGFCYSNKQVLQQWIEEFKPGWVSLQFVPFAFHSKGLPFKLGTFLRSLCPQAKWQIMFHELWVGMEVRSSGKEKFWGFLQKLLIQSLIRHVKPLVIHTQTHLYKTYLSGLGAAPIYLPLFSNIQLAKQVSAQQDEPGTKLKKTFIVFGAIHGGAPVENFAREAAALAKEKGLEIDLKIVGRFGSEHERWALIWKKEGLQAEIFGEKSPEEISRLLSLGSFGISTTPILLLEKSGSVAAMREHGLPVVCITRSWQPRGVTLDPPPGIFEYGKHNLRDLFEMKDDEAFKNNISTVATQFLANLSNFG